MPTSCGQRRSDWKILTALVAWGAVPALAGTARLTELAHGVTVTAANAPFVAMPLPAVLHLLSVIPFSLLGALQFAPAFRERHRGWHRAAGRALLVCGLIGALTALWLTLVYPWPVGDGEVLYVERLVFGTAMLVSLLMAIDAIRRRRFAAHGEWMIRAYAIGMGAGTQVLTHLPYYVLVGKPGESSRAVLMGAGWVINVIAAEWIVWRARTRARTIGVSHSAMRRVMLGMTLLIVPAVASGQSHFTRTNPPGPHAVGLRIVEQYDLSRGYRSATDPYTGKATRGARARPMQTLVWYPAEAGTGELVTAGAYLRLGATADDFSHTSAERARLEAGYLARRVSELTPQRAVIELAAPMTARRDASARAGKFPVVIYAPGYRGPSFENADLCEYLASYGYVVIASPSTGQGPYGMTDDLEGVETQVGDIQYLIGYAHSLPQADTDHLAVIGYSWGGLANVMAAAKDPRIHALVSLDGSVRSYPDVIEQSRFLTPARITAPLLYIAATPRQIEDLPADMNRERSFLNRMKFGDVYRVTLAPYVHANFSVMSGQRFLAEGGYGNYDKDELSIANGWLETYVRHFLDAYSKGDADGRAFLDLPAARTGAPAHLFTVYRAKGEGDPPTRAVLAAALARDEFKRASTIYEALRTRDPGFSLTEDEFNAWGYKLLRDGDTHEALAIFRLNCELHADSWNAFDSLGEAYASDGNRASALVAYRKSLALNPGNRNAADRIKALDEQPGTQAKQTP